MKIAGRWQGYASTEPRWAPRVAGWFDTHARVIPAVFLALCLAALMGPNGPWFLLGLVLLIGAREISPRRAERRERARLLGDCHTQHDALMLGGEQDALAYFGRFQPAGLDGKISWCAPPGAFPTVSRVQPVVPEPTYGDSYGQPKVRVLFNTVVPDDQPGTGRPPPEPVVWDDRVSGMTRSGQPWSRIRSSA